MKEMESTLTFEERLQRDLEHLNRAYRNALVAFGLMFAGGVGATVWALLD